MRYPIKDTPLFVIAEDVSIYNGGFGKIHNCSIIDENEFVVQDGLVMKKISNAMDLPQQHRFDREMRYLQKLNHKNILKPIHCDFDEDYIVMEKYPQNLEDYIRSTQYTTEESTVIYSQILDGVEFYISEGYLHRDLKPQNILLDSENNAKITDFGISSRALREETIYSLTVRNFGAGTQFYCAPEQLRNLKDADERSEVFSLGRILYVLNTKDFRNYEMEKIQELSPQLRSIIKKATEYNPENRYQTVSEFKSAFYLLTSPVPIFNIKDYKVDKVEQLILEKHLIGSEFESDLNFILSPHYEDKVDLMIKLENNIHKSIWKNHNDFYTKFINNICDDIESRSYPFSYVDTIVSSTVSLLRELNNDLDMDLQLRIIKSSVRVAVYHNRFWAMEHIGRYISEIKDSLLIDMLSKEEGFKFKDDLEIILQYKSSDTLKKILV